MTSGVATAPDLGVYSATCAARHSAMDVDRRRIADLERQVETLGVAVEHRTQIGMALGIIMERLSVEQGAAFEYLLRCSQAQNQKVYDLAVRLIETRALPDSQGSRGA